MTHQKDRRSGKKLVVAGCLVERFRDEHPGKIVPEVDAVVGTGEMEKILAAAGVRRRQTNRPRLIF